MLPEEDHRLCAFMAQPGCAYGSHKWFKDDKYKVVTCPYDWLQTSSNVIVKVTIDRRKRSNVDFFVDVVTQWYGLVLVVFTASIDIYGAAELNVLKLNKKNGINVF